MENFLLFIEGFKEARENKSGSEKQIMLEELKKAFQFIVNRERPYRFIQFFAGLVGKKICNLVSSTITATH